MPNSEDKICAVVVPEIVEKCRDILPASSELVKRTPGPFGLTIYAWKENDHSTKTLQPLIYVSEKAAQDRAPEKHVMNGAGVRPGWYWIAQPGRFEVHVSHVNHEHYGLPWEDGLEMSLEVDGHDTNIVALDRQHKTPSSGNDGEDTVIAGFVEKCTISDSGPASGHCKVVEVFRPFAFESASNGLEGSASGSSDIGTINGKVSVGVVFDSKPKTWSSTFKYSEKPANAKDIAREGLTMKVSHRSGEQRHTTYADFEVKDKRSLPEAGIKVYVRERSWLRSRWLVDEDDQPVTYGLFRKLRQQDQNQGSCTRGGSEVNKGPVKNKTKIKEQMVLYDDAEPFRVGEIIDLT